MMDNAEGFRAALQAGTFTFLVGPEKQRFQIHANTISNHSAMFDKMMHGHMKESIEKIAELPDVGAETFTRFASFCYFANYNYNTPEKKPVGSSASTEERFARNCGSLVMAFMELDGRSRFCCYRCAHSAPRRTDSFLPYCSELCAAEKPKKSQRCTKCGKSGPDGLGMLCRDCLSLYPGTLRAGRIYADAVILLRDARWSGLAQQYPNTYPSIVECQTRLKPQNPSNDLIGHAKVLNVFAEMYDMLKPKALALSKLAFDINRFEITKDDVAKVVELLEYVYQNTYSTTDGENHGNLLRKLVVGFAAEFADVLMESEEVQQLVCDGGAMVLDLFKATAKHWKNQARSCR